MNQPLTSTTRIYYQHPQLLSFTAQVLSCNPTGEHWAVVLDQTAFYPTGGGQPNDQGQLGSAQVLDCIDDNDTIIHIVDQPISGAVSGEIDAQRRRDHMQQHTGQHILSQAFIQVAGAETRSFHLGTESATIDIELAQPTSEILRQVEDLANNIIFENRPIRIHLTDEQGVANFPLRKETNLTGCVRIIEIADFDYSPCGGTHARQTGEVGLIVISGWERVKKLCRIEFRCGRRALLDYRAAHQTASETAALFSAARSEGTALAARLQQDYKALQKRTQELLVLALETEANKLYQVASTSVTGKHIVQMVFNQRALDEIKMLAKQLSQYPQTVALLVSVEQVPRLVFARSADLTINCGALLKDFSQGLGGKGGGSSDLAQGGFPAEVDFRPKLQELTDELLKS